MSALYPRFVLQSLRDSDVIFELFKSSVTVGRSSGVDYRLNRDHGSRLHAEITTHRISMDSMDTIAVENSAGEREDWRVQVTDCTSLCGTLVDGRKILPNIPVSLKLNSVVTFGLKERFRLETAESVRCIATSANGRETKTISVQISDAEDANVLRRISPLTWHVLSNFVNQDPNFRLERVHAYDEFNSLTGQFSRFRPGSLAEAENCLASLLPGHRVEFEFEKNAPGWCQNDSSRPAVKIQELFSGDIHTTSILE